MSSFAYFQFGSEDPIEFEIQPGDSILGAWRRVARDYGTDPGRPVTFKAGGVLVSATSRPEPGQTIVAQVSLETKGAARG